MNREAGAAGSKRRILQRLGGAEQRHHAVAGEVLRPAALILDRGGQQFIDLTDQREGGVLADALGNLDKANHVGKQHRDLAPFARRRRRLGGVFCPTARSIDPPVADADQPRGPAACSSNDNTPRIRWLAATSAAGERGWSRQRFTSAAARAWSPARPYVSARLLWPSGLGPHPRGRPRDPIAASR